MDINLGTYDSCLKYSTWQGDVSECQTNLFDTDVIFRDFLRRNMAIIRVTFKYMGDRYRDIVLREEF